MHKKLFLALKLRGWGSIQEWGCIEADTVIGTTNPANQEGFICAYQLSPQKDIIKMLRIRFPGK